MAKTSLVHLKGHAGIFDSPKSDSNVFVYPQCHTFSVNITKLDDKLAKYNIFTLVKANLVKPNSHTGIFDDPKRDIHKFVCSQCHTFAKKISKVNGN